MYDNEILNNNIGIYSQNSNSTINSNIVCENTNLDFDASGWLTTFGNNNTCDGVNNWSDDLFNENGCKYNCDGVFCDIDGDKWLNSTVCGGTDCNDNNVSINPDVPEIPDNQIDDNCNNLTDEVPCDTDNNCSYSQFCNFSTNLCHDLNCSEYEEAFNHNCYHECDLNYDGIIIHDYNDLMTAYKCFLGIGNNCDNYYQNWNLVKQEYECFTGN